jgi:hypothetical protein
MVYDKWNSMPNRDGHMVLVTPSFHAAMKEEDPDPKINDGVRGIHYLVVPEPFEPTADGQHVHFRIMPSKAAIEEAVKRW